MVNVKIARGAGPIVDIGGAAIQDALGGMDLAFVYNVEVDESTVVVAVSPVRRREQPDRGPTLVMHPRAPTLPLFTMYVALCEGCGTDLTDELFARAQAERTAMLYENTETWNCRSRGEELLNRMMMPYLLGMIGAVVAPSDDEGD
jgi:hypothetical protein